MPIWITYSPLTWMIGRILSESSKKTVKPIMVLCKCHAADSFIKCYLTIPLYRATLWYPSSPSLKLLLTKFYWNLSYKSHTGVTHCIARISTVSNIVFDRFCSFFSHAISSPNIFVRSILLILNSSNNNNNNNNNNNGGAQAPWSEPPPLDTPQLYLQCLNLCICSFRSLVTKSII